MSALYREFPLRNASIWPMVVAFIKANAQAFADKGEFLRVIITSDEKKRNNEQNRFYWGGVLNQIAEQAWINGKQFNKDVWHEYLARMYGVCDDLTLPDGEVIVRRKSTTEMSVGEFSEYLNKVQAYATNTLAVAFDE